GAAVKKCEDQAEPAGAAAVRVPTATTANIGTGGIAYIANAIEIDVTLVGIGNRRTIVQRIDDTISVAVQVDSHRGVGLVVAGDGIDRQTGDGGLVINGSHGVSRRDDVNRGGGTVRQGTEVASHRRGTAAGSLGGGHGHQGHA